MSTSEPSARPPSRPGEKPATEVLKDRLIERVRGMRRKAYDNYTVWMIVKSFVIERQYGKPAQEHVLEEIRKGRL